MSDETTLLHCPFCGGEAEIHPSNEWDAKFTGSTYFAWCDKCETRGDYYNTESEAIEAWNTRASDREAELEALVRELWHLVNNRSGYGYAAALEYIEALGIEVDA